MRPAVSKSLRIGAGILISLVFLALALRGVRFPLVWEALAQIDLAVLALAAVPVAVAYLLRAARWTFLLHGTAPMPTFRELFSATLIGAAGNSVLPFRAGEIVRVAALRRRGGTNVATALSSIVLERVLDGLTLLAILALLMTATDFPEWVTAILQAGAALFIGAAIVLALASGFRHRLMGAIERWCRRRQSKKTERIATILDQLSHGLKAMGQPALILPAIAISFLIWGSEALTLWGVGRALDLALAPNAVLLCLIVVNFGLILPAAPGAVGTFEFACILSLGLFGIDRDAAFGFALVLHALLGALLVGSGLIFAAIDQGGFRKLAHTARAKTAKESL